jgi:hypothetical protein
VVSRPVQAGFQNALSSRQIPWLRAISRNGEWGVFSLPLTRGRILGYDVEHMAFQFTMENKGETVDCAISGAAMDQLSDTRGTLPAGREAQFLLLRDAIERIASDTFYSETPVEGSGVRIFAKHVRK